jgi:hypothetical protein
MFEEVGTLQTFFVDSVLAPFATCILRLTELKVLDAAVVVLIPIFVVPGFAQRDELVLSQFQHILLLTKILYGFWNVDGSFGEAFDVIQRDV